MRNRARGLIDATRMEYAGMAAGITYMITTYPNALVEWYCDNKSAVGEIPKLGHRMTFVHVPPGFARWTYRRPTKPTPRLYSCYKVQ